MERDYDKIVDVLINSDYRFAATGLRDVTLEELRNLVYFICTCKEEYLQKQLDDLYKYHPDTINMSKYSAEINCPAFDIDICNCYLPDITFEQRQCIVKREQKRTEGKRRNYPEYKDWRTAVFERDEYICVDCGVRGGSLEAHHVKGFKKHPELRHDVDNGITLCKACHKNRHRVKVNV